MSDPCTANSDPFWQRFYSQQASLEHFGTHSFAKTGTTPDPDHHAWLAPLHQVGLLQVAGAEAQAFLQGQLTADVAQMETGATALAAHCDPKGRMHANFLLHRRAEDCFWLQMPTSVLEIAGKALQKYAVFSKVAVENISEHHFSIGFAPLDYVAGLFGQDALHERAALLLWQQRLGVMVLPREALEEFASWQQRADIAWQGSARWQRMAIDAGVGFVEAITSGAFIPQMLNMDCLDGISFTKGCYTGQEIIARMKYRGSVKRRCWPFTAEIATFDIDHELRTATIFELAAAFAAGAEVSDEKGSLCGQIVNSVVNSLGATSGLLVLKQNAHNDSPDLFVQTSEEMHNHRVPLALAKPPYAIPD